MHIYFIGIGGSGLSPLAQLALDCEYEVSGSDIAHSHGTDAIEMRGVTVGYIQDGTHIEATHVTQPIDYIVYTSACKPDHKELEYAHRSGIPIGKRHEFINTIIKDKHLKMIAVAGTHGKTTTTAMTVWTFQKLGIPCSYLIGSNISFGSAALYQKGSEYFIYEDDEFDRNFLNYHPDCLIVTSIDYDHPDTYPTHKEYYEAFGDCIHKTQSDVVCWNDSYDLVSSKQSISANLHLFDKVVDMDIVNQIHLPGLHNRQNAYLVVQMLRQIFPLYHQNSLFHILSTFPGTQRRFEKIAHHIYSDYAHHPIEIQATLQLSSEINGTVVVVYQPHQNLRQTEIKDQYKTCFDGCSKVYWLDTYLSREPDGIEIIPKEQLGCLVKDAEVVFANLDETLKSSLERDIQSGKLIIAMGAGNIDKWVRDNFA